MTPRLYYADPLLADFTGRVVAHGSLGGRPSVVLAETAFYPESGGQLGDRGLLGDLAVIDVQVDDAGVVHHLVEGPLPAIGAELPANIDRARRRLHMALHTGQHMLSRALVDEARAETVSSRLGESSCTIDVDLDRLADGDVARAEALVNAIVDDDVPVRAWFPEAGELAALPLRRAPKVEADIRVVAIGDFDVSPCGGTHCLRSAQVGLLRVTGLERYKGKMRVSFSAGRRARDELAGHADVLGAMAREMTCGPAEVPTALAKLRRELAGAREALGQARTRLGLAAADELIRSARARGETLVVAEIPDADAELLRAICKRITAEPELAVFAAAPSGDGLHLLCARGAASTVDCGALLKRVTQAAGGRGGGSPERAEGRAPAGTDLAALITRP